MQIYEMITKSKLIELQKAQDEEVLKNKQFETFVNRTDRKNLQFQIQQYIQAAKATYQDKLDEKRKRLNILLKTEDKTYEEEFIYKLKARVDDSIQQRQESLMALKTEKAKEVEEFVKMKKIQQYINNCDEIRLELRNNLLKESKLVQLAQIEENRRKEQLRRDEESLWLEVRRRIEEEQDKRQKYENCLRRRLIEHDNDILHKQILHRQELKEQEKLEALELRRRNEELLKAELAGFAAAEEMEKERKRKQGQLLRGQLQEQICQKNELLQQQAHFECIFNQEINRQMEEEDKILKMKEGKMREAMLRYLEYLNELKKETAAQRKYEAETLESYQKQIQCEQLKASQALKLKKQNNAKQAHYELLQQICDNEERRAKQAKAERETDLIQREIQEREMRKEKENELKRVKAAREYGNKLLEQMEAIQCFRAAAQKSFEEDLKKAAAEDDLCVTLAKKYIQEQIDYLPPHPNWRLMSCPCLKKN